MKLIHCYIDNFGGLRDFSLDFQEGLTVIQQPNGFGKTTLAEFIRAMFYGFPRKPPRGLGRREKYRPWNGGKCGGYLTFEHEGTAYRIERTFGATPKGDACRIFDLSTGRVTDRFSPEVGVELFGLDADSFERSTYLPQSRETGLLTTDSIRAKLTGLVEDTDDVGNFDKAMQTLRAKRSAYLNYRGQGGSVAEAVAQITRTQQALTRASENAREAEELAQTLAALEEEQTRLASLIEETRRDITAAGDAALRQTHHRRLRELNASLAQTKARLDALAEKYPRGLPTIQALESAADAVERLGALTQQPATEAEERAQQFLAAHQGRFACGVPEGEEFDRVYQVRDRRRGLELELDAARLPEGEAAELDALVAEFAAGRPEEDVLRHQEEALEKAARLRRENLDLASQTVAEPRYKVPSPLAVPLLLGGGCTGALAGFLLLLRGDGLPGGAVLALGVVLLLAALWLRRRSAETRQVHALSPQVQALVRENEERAAALEGEVRAFMADYGGISPAQLRQRLERLGTLSRRETRLAEQRREIKGQLSACDTELRAFFDKYHCRADGEPGEVLNRFRRLCDTWERAQKLTEDLAARQEAHRREEARARKVLEDFWAEYGAAPRTRAQVLTIRDDLRQRGELTAALAELEAQTERHRRVNAAVLAEPEPQAGADPALLRRREAALLTRQKENGEKLMRLRQKLRQCRTEAEGLAELEDALVRWQEKKDADAESARVLDDTMAFLSQARDNLSTAYMGTIRRSFSDLLGRMAGEEPGRIMVTPELEVRLERDGASRALGYFSAGQTDTVLLCMRLALVDALFREAKPFVILDDPFVNLDDGRTREALALLRELSRDRQILYLVCNSSRV